VLRAARANTYRISPKAAETTNGVVRAFRVDRTWEKGDGDTWAGTNTWTDVSNQYLQGQNQGTER
jgi:hypothetical protein